jgi:glycine/D-amino acid oxidase-like deaminating enzyme
VTEQVPPAGTPDLAPQQGTSSGTGARAGAGRQSRAPRSSPAARTGRQRSPQVAESADVIVVGAGPAGSATGYHLASSGLDVLVLEKTTFPREKVCGDGLTPRAVKALATMGVPLAEGAGWQRHKGLRIIGGGGRIELDWPDLSSYPGYGLIRARTDFDQLLARHAATAGAKDRGSADQGRSAVPRAAGRGRGRQFFPAVGGDGPAQAR